MRARHPGQASDPPTPLLPHTTGDPAFRSHSAFLGLSLTPSPDFQEPQFLPTRGHLLHAVSRERPQAWPLCNDQITAVLGDQIRGPFILGPFRILAAPAPQTRMGRQRECDARACLPEPEAGPDSENNPLAPRATRGLPGPGLEEAPLGPSSGPQHLPTGPLLPPRLIWPQSSTGLAGGHPLALGARRGQWLGESRPGLPPPAPQP